MPSWNDSETSSSSDSLVSFHNEMTYEIFYDENFEGMEDQQFKGQDLCMHGKKLRKYVSFEGENTGRRFLGCSNMIGGVCAHVEWVDQPWPAHLKNCVVQLWSLLDHERKKNLEHAETYYKLHLEKKESDELVKTLQVQLGESIKEQQIGEVSSDLLNVHKMLRDKAVKQRDDLKAEKRKLEYYIAELLKLGEANKDKLEKIKDILNE